MAFIHRPTNAKYPFGTAERISVERLQADLHRSEHRLHEALSEVMAANTELRASNQEQQILNEELSTANEELEASETALQALNGELERRVSQLAQANSDMRSVIDSTRIAIVFLDSALRVRSFTPAVRDVLHLMEADHGRPITDFALQLSYPGLVEDVRRVLHTHEAVERQAGHKQSAGQYLVRLLPHRGADERVAGVVITFLDITATVLAEQALRASDERFRRMAAAVPTLLFIAGCAAQWDYVNPPFYALTGQPDGEALGLGWSASMHPDDLQATQQSWREASLAASILDHEARLRRADGTWCWHLIRAVPQLDGTGQVVRWYGSCTDIDERRRAEKRQGLLLAELQHRIKNILAVVRSVLTRTLESSTGLDHFATHLAGRIGALARTQCVAARTPEGFVMLEDIFHEEFEAHGGGDDVQFEVEGPSVMLPARTADAIGLAIHELTTNSFKYGALAASSGRVAARWRVEPEAGTQAGMQAGQRLLFEWQESGVPVTDLSPKRRGFGRELIEQGLPYELGAITTMKFRPGGLHCSIEFSLPGPTLPPGRVSPWA